MGEIINVQVTMPKRILTMELYPTQAKELIMALNRTDILTDHLPDPYPAARTLFKALYAIKDGLGA